MSAHASVQDLFTLFVSAVVCVCVWDCVCVFKNTHVDVLISSLIKTRLFKLSLQSLSSESFQHVNEEQAILEQCAAV